MLGYVGLFGYVAVRNLVSVSVNLRWLFHELL
jgi:hypothetical protein